MKKHRIAAVFIAVFLLAASMSVTAYAVELDDPPEDITAAADMEAGTIPEDDGPVIPDEPTTSAVDEQELVAPPGTGTVVEHGINGDNKEFYTIMTAEEYVFYLIIDHERTGQNVYFLNAVTINDLVALAEQDGRTINNGSISVIPGTNTDTEKPKTDEPAPDPSPEPDPAPESGGNMRMIIFVVVVLIGGGGAAYYFKIIRPKQQGADSGDDYDYSEDEADPYGGDDSAEPEDESASWYDEDESADDYDDAAGDDEDGGDGDE